MVIEDYNDLFAFWKSIDGIGMRTVDDSKDGIRKFLDRNPNNCFVYIEEDMIIGVILGGHDGRRGYIYHAAVSPDKRSKGIGRILVDKTLESLKEEGINKVALVVFKGNELGNTFWEKYGFINRDDLNYRNISLNKENIQNHYCNKPWIIVIIGFNKHPVECFHINKIGIKFNNNIINKSGTIIYHVWHEYEIKENGKYYDIWCDFGYFCDYEEERNKITFLKNHSKVGKKYPDSFEIYEVKIDNDISWEHGFNSNED